MSIPTTCKAGLIANAGPNFRLNLDQVQVPKPGPGELLVKLNVTGLCASDVHDMIGDTGARPSDHGVSSVGHEGAGIVVQVGPEVQGWSVGDRAGVKPIWSVCHDCEQCRRNMEQYCTKAEHTGVTKTGTYQEYILTSAMYTVRIPASISDDFAAPLMCSASTMYRALKDSHLGEGSWVVFPGGGGGVGIQGVQIAKIFGMRPIVIDSGARKQELALAMGAEAFFDFTIERDIPKLIRQLTENVGAHGVIVTAWQGYKDALSLLGDRIGGILVCVGLPPADLNIQIAQSPLQFALKRQTVTGSIVGTMQDTYAVLDLAERGLLQPIHEIRRLGQLIDSIEQLRKGDVAGRIVIEFNEP